MFSRKIISRRTIVGSMLFALILVFAHNTFASSTISGIISDKQRNPLVDVDVELLNDFYQQIRRVRSDGSGRYTFEGLNDGRFSVRVLPFRYDLEDQTQSVEISTVATVDVAGQRKPGSSFQVLDFTLLPKKGGLAETELGVVFAQAIPPEAKKLYEKAMLDFNAKRTTEGILGMNKAVELFPDYYLALHRVGKELFIMKKYEEAVPFLFKAAQVNPKSATSFYYLGYSLSFMGKDYYKAAVAALNQSYIMAPASAPVLYILGRVERLMGNFANAEKHLLQAKKVSKVTVPEIHKELAQLYANDMKKYEAAASELEIYLKNSKPDEAESKQMKKIISDLREKAKSKPGV